MTEIDFGYGCCQRFYFYGKHSFRCKVVNAFDADFSRGDLDIRAITVEEMEVYETQRRTS